MAKFYKVIKDHPMWEVGCIISNKTDGDSYYPVHGDMYLKDIKGVTERWHEGDDLVENQPEWFQRVYEVDVLGKVKYLAKDAARAAYEQLYKEK